MRCGSCCWCCCCRCCAGKEQQEEEEKEKWQERGESGVVYIQRSYATGCRKGNGSRPVPQQDLALPPAAAAAAKYRAGTAQVTLLPGGEEVARPAAEESHLSWRHTIRSLSRQASLLGGLPISLSFVFKHSCPALLRGTRPCLSCSPVSPSICTRPRFDTRKLDYASCWQPSPRRYG